MQKYEEKLIGATDLSGIGLPQAIASALDLTRQFGKPVRFFSIRDSGGFQKLVLVFPGDRRYIFTEFQTGYRGSSPENLANYLGMIGTELSLSDIAEMKPPAVYIFQPEKQSPSIEREVRNLLNAFNNGGAHAFELRERVGKIGEPAIPILQRILNDDLHGEGARAAIIALQDISSDLALPLIEKSFQSNYTAVHTFAAEYLEKHPTDNAKEIARKQLPIEQGENARGHLRRMIGYKELGDIVEAAANDDLPAMKEMLKRGIDVNQRNKVGRTALMVGARNGSLEVVKWLLSKGADVNAAGTEIELSTALMNAAYEGNSEVVRILLSAGANRHAESAFGFRKTALDIAKQKGHSEVVQLLRR